MPEPRIAHLIGSTSKEDSISLKCVDLRHEPCVHSRVNSLKQTYDANTRTGIGRCAVAAR